MIHSHYQENLNDAVKPLRLKSHRPSIRAEDVEDLRSEAEGLQRLGINRGGGILSDQQRAELNQVAERNKPFLSPIQAVWPTPSA